MASGNAGKYDELINQAGADYAEAKARYQKAAAARRETETEINDLIEERAAVQGRINEFDAGRLVIPDDQYLADLDRARLLGGKINARRPLLETRKKNEQDEIEKLNHAAGGARQRLISAIEADTRQIMEAARAQLEAALK